MNRIYKRGAVIIALLAVVVYSGFLYEDRTWHTHPHHDHSDLYHEHSHSVPSTELPERLLFPTREPDRVILNLTEEPETSLAVNWRTEISIDTGFVEFAIATAGPEFTTLTTRLQAKKESLKTKYLDEPLVSANYFSARIEKLTPGKKYVYRV